MISRFISSKARGLLMKIALVSQANKPQIEQFINHIILIQISLHSSRINWWINKQWELQIKHVDATSLLRIKLTNLSLICLKENQARLAWEISWRSGSNSTTLLEILSLLKHLEKISSLWKTRKNSALKARKELLKFYLALKNLKTFRRTFKFKKWTAEMSKIMAVIHSQINGLAFK